MNPISIPTKLSFYYKFFNLEIMLKKQFQRIIFLICLCSISLSSLFSQKSDIIPNYKQLSSVLVRNNSQLTTKEDILNSQSEIDPEKWLSSKKHTYKSPQAMMIIDKRSKVPNANNATTLTKEVNIVKAGTLSTSLTNNDLKVTDLTITGKLDARDFKFIRESLNYLSTLDIRNVLIESYTGSAGTDTVGIVKTYPENALPQCAFWNSETHVVSNLTALFLPGTITSIGDYAFLGQKYLSSIDIPPFVKTIGEYAFHLCENLSSLQIPGSVTEIKSYAFSLTALKSVHLPNTVKKLGSYVFWKNSKLTDVNIETIECGFGTFKECQSLNSVIFAPTVKTINYAAFAGSGLKTIEIPATVNYISIAFEKCRSLKTASISADTIGILAFNDTELDSVTITKDVSCIESFAFKGTKIATVEIPSSVKSMGLSVFDDCMQLKSATIAAHSIGKFAFQNLNLSTVIITNDVSQINHLAFQGTKLTSVIIPSSVISMGYGVFENCKFLTTATISSSVIGTYCFTGTNLKTVSLREGIKIIGEGAFALCNRLDSITLPASVDSIQPYAFCAGVGSISVNSGNKKFSSSDGVLFNKNQSRLIQYPLKGGNYIIPATVESIASFALGCGVSSVFVPSSVSSIDKFGFANFTAYSKDSIVVMGDTLKSVVFEKDSKLEYISQGMFIGSIGLEKCELPSSIKIIGNAAFAYCSNLKLVNIPLNTDTIKSFAFGYCTRIDSVYSFASVPPVLEVLTTEDNSLIHVFEKVDRNKCVLSIPFGSTLLYKNSAEWSSFKNIVEFQVPEQKVKDPQASIDSGSIVSKGSTVFLTCSTLDAFIYYTLDGTSPVDLSGTRSKYYQPIIIDRDMTILTVAEKNGMIRSNVSEFTYYIEQEPVIDVVISRKWDDVLVCHNNDDLFSSYQWYRNNVLLVGETKQYFQESGGLKGDYYVQITTTEGISGKSNTISVGNQSIGIRVAPNPVENGQDFYISIQASIYDLEKAQLYIYNSTGALIVSQTRIHTKMSFNGLTSGCYMIMIKMPDNRILQEKVIVN